MKATKLSVFCDKVLEMGWVLAVIVTPLFFNVYSSRVFEPDKLTTLRTIAVVMAAVWLVKIVEEWLGGRRKLDVTWRTPLVLPTVFTVIVYLLSTALSVTPRVSFFGSYQRMQGTFTTLSYIVVFLIILQGMRARAQMDRLVTVIILTSLPIAVYGLIQHNRADPLPWGGDVTERVASNMGNAIFVAAYLIMIVPLTLTRIVSTFRSILTDEKSGTADVLGASAYIFILLAQLITIYFSQSRGPMLGLLGGLGVWALLGTLLLQRAPQTGEGVRSPRLPGAWGRNLSYGLVGVAAVGLFALGIAVPGSSKALSVALAAGGVVLAVPVAWGVAATNGRSGFLARSRPVAAILEDLGRALSFLLLSAAAALVAAGLLHVTSRAILSLAARAGTATMWYATAAATVVLFVGLWLAYSGRGLGWWLAGIFGILVILLLVVFLARGQTNPPLLIAGGGALLATLATWLLFIVNRWGWRWLWMSVLALAVLGGGVFFSINPGGPLHKWARTQPTIRRYTSILASEGGTARVRSLIWEGALEMVLPHDPIQFPPTDEYPRGRTDAINWLRPVIGYGPESMYVAYNSFYPPLLGHYESRTASPDRSHNETMDSLVITGVLGLAAYVWLFGSVIYFGLRWLGLLGPRWQRNLFFSLLGSGVALILAAVLATVGPSFLGLTVPVGLVVGLLVYLAVSGLARYWEKETPAGLHPRVILLIGIMATVVAHLIEINFGIAIAATRTTFWALAGVLVVAGTGLCAADVPAAAHADGRDVADGQAGDGSKARARRRRKRRKSSAAQVLVRSTFLAWFSPILTAGVIGGFILGTLAFDFVTNAERLVEPLDIVWRALTVLPAQGGRTSYGALLIFAVTWLMSALLLIPEVARRGADAKGQPDWGLATVIYLLISLTIGLVFGLVLANRQVSFLATPTTMDELIAISDRIAGLQTLYYGFLLFAVVAGAVSLMLGLRQIPKTTAHPWGAISLLVLGVAATAIIVPFNLQPIQADIVYKQADPYDRQGQWTVSVEQYGHALELAPKEDFYKLYLGRALLELATVVQDTGAQEDVLRDTEAVLVEARETNPLNTDHSANLARMYRRWAGLTEDKATRHRLLDLSTRNYEIATTLSPSNALLWNEWSLLHYWDLRDVDGYERVHERSLAIDPEYEQTWLICGDISRDQGKLEEAIRCYEEALRLKPDQPQVWRVLADTYIAQQDWDSAIDALSRVVELQPADRTPDIWSVHHVLSQLYLQIGDRDRALQAAIRAVQLVPQNQITVVQNWLAQLQSTEAPQE